MALHRTAGATAEGPKTLGGHVDRDSVVDLSRNTAMSAKPQTIDEYLAPLSDEKRAALEKLRKAIKSAAPQAEECISYQIPTFRLDGRFLVSFGAAKNHCAFYPGAFPLEAHKDKLKPNNTSKATTPFKPTSPFPPPRCGNREKPRIPGHAPNYPVPAYAVPRP